MCGEKTRYRRSALVTVGSPPRMRGKDLLRRFRAAQHRITPACAGKSFTGCRFAHVVEDHPRMCGEKSRNSIMTLTSSGSPPHVRGKENLRIGILQNPRITPACAGKSCHHHDSYAATEDHPRMCGEKTPMLPCLIQPWGSPPHVRGKACAKWLSLFRFRITPACAGKSVSFRSTSLQSWDHPRMCGEKSRNSIMTLTSSGSPPHVRGKENLRIGILQNPRITPACAGKRCFFERPGGFVRDHPRMCGEKTKKIP